jgi:hypothetical protein
MNISGALVLIVGIMFLLRDFKVWVFWGITWVPAAFILYGAMSLASANCKDCQLARR